MAARTAETRDGVELTSLDGPLFDGAEHTKRDLVDYLDAVRHAILPALAGRALSVMRVRPGQQPFMQKNLPKYAPDWIARTTVWAEASHREVTYPLCDDRRTLLWLANQRAVEYHPALIRAGEQHASHLVLDLDPPEGDDFAHVVRAAMLIRRVLDDLGLVGAVKTSGSKGVHVVRADHPDSGRGLRRRDPRPGRPRGGARPGDRDHGVHPRRPRRQGLPRLHPIDRRDGRRRLQPADPPGAAGVVPGGLGRPPARDPGRLHGVDRRRTCWPAAIPGRRRCRSPRSSRPS